MSILISLYIVATVSGLLVMLYEQFKLFELFKEKKHPDYPVTVRDAYEHTKMKGYKPYDDANSAMQSRRYKIIMSRYPEDKTLDRQAQKVRVLFLLTIIIMIAGFLTALVYTLTLPRVGWLNEDF